MDEMLEVVEDAAQHCDARRRAVLCEQILDTRERGDPHRVCGGIVRKVTDDGREQSLGSDRRNELPIQCEDAACAVRSNDAYRYGIVAEEAL